MRTGSTMTLPYVNNRYQKWFRVRRQNYLTIKLSLIFFVYYFIYNFLMKDVYVCKNTTYELTAVNVRCPLQMDRQKKIFLPSLLNKNVDKVYYCLPFHNSFVFINALPNKYATGCCWVAECNSGNRTFIFLHVYKNVYPFILCMWKGWSIF